MTLKRLAAKITPQKRTFDHIVSWTKQNKTGFTPEISNQNFRANYMNMFLLWAKPLSDPA